MSYFPIIHSALSAEALLAYAPGGWQSGCDFPLRGWRSEAEIASGGVQQGIWARCRKCA